MQTHLTSDFTYIKETKTFVAEISDFRNQPFDLYGCFNLRSVKTGKIEKFRGRGAEREISDNEIEAWVCEPVNEELRKAGILVKFFND